MHREGGDWYSLPPEHALEVLETSAAGLDQQQVEARLSRHGVNRLQAAARRSPLARFLLQFHNVLIYVLIGSAVITAALGHWSDTLVIAAVVVANAVIGFIQEGKAERAMEAIRQMLAPRASVIRGGERVGIDAIFLVPGDIVVLAAGDKVPADLRLLSAHGMSVQEAILTGESVPVEKQADAVAAGTVLGERACMAWSGTLVVSGQGMGVVVATGGDTEIGRISHLLSEVQSLATPLVRQMDTFARWLTVVILAIAALLLLHGYFAGHLAFADIFMSVVGLSVAAIPEGLPAVLTITLAVGVQAMARRHAIIRRLPAIETLGSVSVICTDKTGTLTRNEMAVASVLTHRQRFTLEGDGYSPEGDLALADGPLTDSGNAVLEALARAAVLCNDAVLRQQDGVWVAHGNPMEGALLSLAGKIGVEGRAEQAAWTRTDTIPFDARHRFMATLNHDHNYHAGIFVKGAPERVLAMCRDQLGAQGEPEPLQADYWNREAEAIASQGQRVLALASKAVEPGHTVLERGDVEGSLTLLGLVGMIDPPRPEAVAAVAVCLGAGIRVKMITGDHATTALAIGRQIGLQNREHVLTGADMDRMDEGELGDAVLDCDIFARTSPEHKLRLVTALQAHGMTVAMTGDGVNDAPALKRADAGIAMGQKGSEVAKEAAVLVLADDNFASIVAAVREGRTVYDNLKKVISWTLPTSTGEAMTIIVALLFGMTLPVTPVQILWINLITAATLGMALAFEPTEENTMKRPPRLRDEPLIDGQLVWHIVFVSILFLLGVYGVYYHAMASNYSLELARTLAVNTLVVMEIFHLFFIRNIYGTSLTWKAVRGTRAVWLVVAIVTVAQFAITYLPLPQAILATESVPLRDGALVVLIGVALFVILEAEKQLRLALRRSRGGDQAS